MTNYKSNSLTSRKLAEQQSEEKPKFEKVVTGAVTTKKKSGFRKAADSFLTEDAGKIKSYVVEDILLPALKDGIWKAVTGVVEMVLFGETRSSNRKVANNHISYRDYSSISTRDYDYDRHREARTTGFDLDDIRFNNRGDAEMVLRQLDDAIYTYKFATVGDLYDLAGESCSHTAYKYGWTNLNNAGVMRLSNGQYVIRLPKALPID